MSGLTHSPGEQHLARAGLRYVASGNGSTQDWEVKRARKPHGCDHLGPWNRRHGFEFACLHPTIEPGEIYVVTRQGFMEESALSMPCAIEARVYEPVD